MSLGIVFLYLLHGAFFYHFTEALNLSKLSLSYFLNFAVAVIIFLLLFKLQKRFRSILGFLFMGGSLFKLVVFFSSLYPIYMSDEIMDAEEITSFMLPYSFCLYTEVKYLTKLLNFDNKVI
jgi:glucan phosphoethanolaminetransferase (alkaline phosphatase superfamily)